ncbi:hypothetical protein [Arthrobacter sp. UYEF20]|uniref:hypothetical protein n=1 Tax=Arthrobacter sp. UYEF20 TaxID=1756363 RepID=UPI0033944889
MRGTLRGLNRVLLGLLGLVLIAAGTLTAAAGHSPQAAAVWTARASNARVWIRSRLAAAPAGNLGVSWWTLAALAVLVIAIILVLGWVLSQGGGRTSHIGVPEAADHGAGPVTGTTTVDTSLAAAAIRDALGHDDRIRSVGVTSWNIKGTGGLKIAIQAAKGSSPRDITDTAEEAIQGLEQVLGRSIPVLIRISTGLRNRFAGTQRVQ